MYFGYFSQKNILSDYKNNLLRGDLTDISAYTATLVT